MPIFSHLIGKFSFDHNRCWDRKNTIISYFTSLNFQIRNVLSILFRLPTVSFPLFPPFDVLNDQTTFHTNTLTIKCFLYFQSSKIHLSQGEKEICTVSIPVLLTVQWISVINVFWHTDLGETFKLSKYFHLPPLT